MVEQGFEQVAKTSELPPGEMRLVNFGGEEVLLVNAAGNLYAVSDSCTHRGGSLSDGEFDGEQVQCHLHGAKFNVVTGEVIEPPARESVQVYQVRISGEDIFVGPAKT